MSEPQPMAGWRHRFEWRIAAASIALVLIAALLGTWCIWQLPLSLWLHWLLEGVLILVLVALFRVVMNTATAPLHGLANVVEAYRGGDYTLRSSRALRGDALGDLVLEINALGGTLHEQRLKAMEATALLDKLIGVSGVAILAFDGERRLRLMNPAAAELLNVPSSAPEPRSARDLGVEILLSESTRPQVITSLGGRIGRWQVVHGTFRESGLSQHLLVISDVQPVLREEERAAWQRLIRVIGHEVNNSLTPIKSMAESLKSLLGGLLASGQVRDDTLDALGVIADRTAGLGRFLAQYDRLARLPTIRPRWQPLAPVLARVVALEPLCQIVVRVPADLEVYVDADHMEQALINLAKNAIEADAGGDVTMAAEVRGTDVVVTVADEGAGIANADNLFVPFFTTKPGGSGVGLVLSRQIAEAHRGTLTLENRTDRGGALATLILPGAARRETERQT